MNKPTMFMTDVDKIIVKQRIRKEVNHTRDLADDIEKNGLLNPVTVMSLDDGTFQLLAGLRRIKAVQMLGWAQIPANIVSPADVEAALRIEISENEQREPFTFSEKMDFARLLEDAETAKAQERKSAGGKGGLAEEVDGRPPLEQGKSRDIIGEKIGMSGRQYDRAKYVADNAPPEMIAKLNKGECSINKAYDKLRKKAAAAPSEGNTVRMSKDKLEIESLKRYISQIERFGVNLQKELDEAEQENAVLKARIAELEGKV